MSNIEARKGAWITWDSNDSDAINSAYSDGKYWYIPTDSKRSYYLTKEIIALVGDRPWSWLVPETALHN